MVNSVKPYSLRASVRIRTLISFLEPDIIMILLVHHGGITAYIVRLFSFVTLTQVNLFRLRCSGIVSGFVLVLTTLSFRDIIVVFLSRSREKKKSLLALLLTVFPSLLLEKEKGNGTCRQKHNQLGIFKKAYVMAKKLIPYYLKECTDVFFF